MASLVRSRSGLHISIIPPTVVGIGKLLGDAAMNETTVRAPSGTAPLVAVTLGALMPGLATTILSVANGSLSADLRVGLGDLAWITTAYLLGLTGSLVLAGALGDRFGRRRIFLIGIGGFGLTSLLIGFSTPLGLIIGLRVAQGVFGGFLTTNALSLLRANVPEQRLPGAVGIFNSVQGLSIAAGPIVGGLIVQAGGWRWTMFLNVPIALICLIVGAVVLREVRIQTTARFDIAGTVLLVGSLTALVYALIDAPATGWTAPSTLILIAVALVALVAFIFVERRAAAPLVPLSLFRERSFAAGAVLSVLAFFALNGGLFVVSLFWLQIQRVPATTVGVWLLPLGLAMLVGAIASGRLIDRIGDRWALVIGSLLVAAGLASTSLAQVEGGYTQIGIGLSLIGLGLGLLVTATVNATVGNAPVALAGPASGVQQTGSRLGATLGVAVLGAVMAATTGSAFTRQLDDSELPKALTNALQPSGTTAVAGGIAPIPAGADPTTAALITDATHHAFLTGMHATMLIAAVIAALGAVVALVVRRTAIRSTGENNAPQRATD
ncbi:DHA2 family efflux MFS transporter permease subunit [Curtobacterium sp. MCBD17_023]|uniref:DHA2 family efflux MFS transporter permease subunit n=1 Tax=Curtobacterium sp. MCBD17_023 TaxID=2175657 RepID=UPI000D8DFFCF|nr:DHA2 family efflux MFS transporter permease subunit [Curtobacterium sp. MCBD17_023]PYY48098.1 MFS transporter [Curtobacterium sp. MCBD17_023]